jgi:hypothetical protein
MVRIIFFLRNPFTLAAFQLLPFGYPLTRLRCLRYACLYYGTKLTKL